MIEALLSAAFEFFVSKVFYWPGWVLLRGISFGNYPPIEGSPHNREFVAAIGLFSTLGIIMTIAVTLQI